MPSIPFALSVHHFISSVGADAGFASLIGLALLVLLYFAHARETATLRSRADEAGLRVQELEAQLADLADQIAGLPAEISVRAAGSRVVAASGGVQQRVAAGAVAQGTGQAGLVPAAPAGMAGPALASATRLIPMPESPAPTPAPAPEPASATMAGGNGSSRVPVAAGAGTIQRPVQAPAGAPPRPPTGPGRAVGGAGRSVGPITGQPRPTGGQPRPGAGRPGAYPNGSGARAGGSGGSNSPMRPAPQRSRTGRVIAAILVAAIGVAAVVVAVLVLTHKSSSPKLKQTTSALSSSQANRRARSATAVVNPSTVTVSVLNGTDLTGLAGRVSAKLTAGGFRRGAVTDASNQTETTSTVAYLAPTDRADALAVATALKLKASSVQPVDANTKSVACSFTAAGCTSPVYVTVGSDLASQ
jgi:hypothetical protein